jgi:hypothetical protein
MEPLVGVVPENAAVSGLFICTFAIPHRHMERGGHGLPKVLPQPAMLDLSMPCRQAALETALWQFQEWPTHGTGAGGLQPSTTPLDNPNRTPMAFLGTAVHAGDGGTRTRLLATLHLSPITMKIKSSLTFYRLLLKNTNDT